MTDSFASYQTAESKEYSGGIGQSTELTVLASHFEIPKAITEKKQYNEPNLPFIMYLRLFLQPPWMSPELH